MFLIAVLAVSAPVAAPGAGPGSGEVTSALPWLDSAHGTLTDAVVRSCDGVDRFLDGCLRHGESNRTMLVDEKLALNGSDTFVTVSPAMAIREEGGTDFPVRFRARIDLPRMEDRVQVILENLEDDGEILPDLAPVSARGKADSAGDEGARLLFRVSRTVRSMTDFSLGLALRPEPIPKARLRIRFAETFGRWRAMLSERLFWNADAGFGEQTRLDFCRPVGPAATFTSSSALLCSETSDGLEWGQSLGIRYYMPGDRQVALKTGATGPTRSVDVREYTLRIPCRQRLYGDWAYLEIEPGVDFAGEDAYRAAPLLVVRMEFEFGHPPAKRGTVQPPPAR